MHSIAERAEVIRELEELHGMAEEVLPSDQHAFHIPLEEHRERQPWKIK